MSTYKVTALRAGQFSIPGPELFWMSNWSDWFELELIVVLIQGNGVTALVNTGPPDDLTNLNELFVGAVGERGRITVDESRSVVKALAEAGVAPDDVTHVIVTPFQEYASGGIHRFPKAQVCLSRRGWEHFHTTHDHPHDNRRWMFPSSTLASLVTERWSDVRLLDDEDEVAPGLRTWFAGTHHRASIAVEIETTLGTVVASDAFFHFANVEENKLLGINENMYEGLATYARAREAAAHLLPLYDPAVFERYPDGRIAP
jgi:glyoxylase-like metal-dependent hydrolase (beta-lactamase superfamily II)